MQAGAASHRCWPRASRGFVYLVGAGPGDPGLLTVRALELLRSAEVVAHDELVPEAILALAPADAERLAVGRRHGAGDIGYRLHPEVLVRARAGRVVVRLKAGDPMVFGRGGEEAEALVEAGIPFEIVPGISAALGAAARVGIPLTHRTLASRVTFATGHEASCAYGEPHRAAAGSQSSARAQGPRSAQQARGGPAGHDGRADARPRHGARAVPDGTLSAPGELASPLTGQSGTIVLFMATRRLAANLDGLVAAGRDPETPAAYIAAATTPHQQVVLGTLGTLAGRAAHIDRAHPGLVIVGEVASLAPALDQSGARPLSGRRLLVGRARPGRSRIAADLRGLGATVLEAPFVEVEPLGRSEVAAALSEVGRHDAVVLGCAEAVEVLAAGCPAPDGLAARLGAGTVVAVGAAAQQALARHGVRPALGIEGACEAALAGARSRFAGARLLLLGAEAGRPELERALAELGAVVEKRALYRTTTYLPMPPWDPVDAVILPSTSAVRALLRGRLGATLAGVPAIAIGPRTEAEARARGVRHVHRAAADTPEAVIAAVLALLGPDLHNGADGAIEPRSRSDRGHEGARDVALPLRAGEEARW